MKKKSPLSYAFAVGKIRALEKSLIRSETYAQALQLDAAAALRLLSESGYYGEELAQVKSSRQLEEILQRSLRELKQLMRFLLLDRKLWKYLELSSLGDVATLLAAYPSRFLEDYVKHLADMHNIRSFLRLRLLAEPAAKLDEQITVEGFISKKTFATHYGGSLAAFLAQLEYVPKHGRMIDYGHLLKAGVERMDAERSFAALERAQADFMIEQLKQGKRITFGPEPVLAYFFARANEISLIRLLILGKMNGVPSDTLKERMNATYA